MRKITGLVSCEAGGWEVEGLERRGPVESKRRQCAHGRIHRDTHRIATSPSKLRASVQKTTQKLPCTNGHGISEAA